MEQHMPFSLAECILRYHDPNARGRLVAAAPKRQEPGGAYWGSAEAARAREEVAGLRSLLGEVSREWSELLTAVAELKKTLRPEELEEAFASAGLSAFFRKGEGDPASVADRDAGSAAPGARIAENAPAETPEVHDRILEILHLLRQNLRENAAAKPSMVEIPKSMTMEIAREVAGRVRDSLTTLPPSPAGDASHSERPSPAPPRRIPLDDVTAIIDQITGAG
jgi:hypothetical protein